ncbi:MAG: hypothetical protein PUH99_03910 [Firmicutes bacterium]|nr:hypothetical protein [Bacillota bacterium]MDY5531527.1 hypothetical protein [Pumilibacteraceae bacterium]
MKKGLKLTAYVSGSIIGAGFASGKEIVAFLGKNGLNAGSAIACFCMFFVCGFIFLSIGSIVKGGNFGKVNAVIMPKTHGFFDCFSVFNGVIVLSAMLAVIGGIGNSVRPLGITYSACFALFVLILARKGKSRVMSGSLVLMFLTVAIIIAVSIENFSSGEGVFDGKVAVFSCMNYVAMNMLLSASAMVSEKSLSLKQRIFVSAAVALVLSGLIFILGYAIRCAGCEDSPMPVFALSSRLGKTAYYAAVLLIVLSATATSLTVCIEISEFFKPYADKTFSLVVILLVALIIGSFGFERVVERFYPIIGVIGVLYFFAAVRFLTAFAFNKFFRKGNDKVHHRRKRAKNYR